MLTKPEIVPEPECVDLGIVRMMIRANDLMIDDVERARWLADLIPLTLNTQGSFPLHMRRAYKAADWACRWAAPYALRLFGLREPADKLEALVPVTDRATALFARDCAQAARFTAYAATADAAYAAAAAADADAYTATYAAADTAAFAAATAYAAYAATADAAAYAAYAAAAAAVSGSRVVVWQSWHDLMIELCAMIEEN